MRIAFIALVLSAVSGSHSTSAQAQSPSPNPRDWAACAMECQLRYGASCQRSHGQDCEEGMRDCMERCDNK
jgi:hypothetical protein